MFRLQLKNSSRFVVVQFGNLKNRFMKQLRCQNKCKVYLHEL